MTTRRVMTARRFSWTLRVLGADIAGWPQDDRIAALALLKLDAGSRALLADTLEAEDGGVGGSVGADAAGLCRMQSVVRAALAPATPLVRVLSGAALVACVVAGAGLGLATAVEADAAWGPVPTIEATTSATVMAALDP